MTDPTAEVRARALRAKVAARALRTASSATKDRALHAIAARLRASVGPLREANAEDLVAARAAGLPAPMIDRLTLTDAGIQSIARAVEEIAALPDPVGAIDGLVQRPSGIVVGRMRVPLGVIGMIYESRPNVTVDAAALCLKSGNTTVLRGGKEAVRSNEALLACVHGGLADAGLPVDAVVAIPPHDRETTKAMLGLVGVLDVVIPRGGEGLVRFVAEHARVPVIAHYQGVCHLFVDDGADLASATDLVLDGKSRPGVCNALECLLVHANVAAGFLPQLDAALDAAGIEVRAEPAARAHMPHAEAAADDDFGREFLAKILAVRVVDSIDGALEHVARYGSGHTEAILTPSYAHADRFLHEVDASCVLVNASTRFNDGGELGLGAELGIATTKLHAYGPMGLEELTTRKWVVYGHGERRGGAPRS